MSTHYLARETAAVGAHSKRLHAGAVVLRSFDYASVSSSIAEDLRKQAARIRSRIAQTTADMIETGRDLIAAKQHIDHGQFTAWIEAELGITSRTAQRYMQAAEWAEGKNDIMSLLAPTVVCRLAAKSTPSKVVDDVIARSRAGELMPDKLVAEMISGAKGEERRAKRDELKRLKGTVGWKRKREKREQRARETFEAEQKRQREEIAAKVSALIDKIGVDAAWHVVETFTDVYAYRLVDALREALAKDDAAHASTPR
jgi:hypothetical protein